MGTESTVALMAAATVAPLVADGGDVVELTALLALLVGARSVLGSSLGSVHQPARIGQTTRGETSTASS